MSYVDACGVGECVFVLAFNQHNTHAHSQCLFNSIFTLLSLCVWVCVRVAVCVVVCVRMCDVFFHLHFSPTFVLGASKPAAAFARHPSRYLPPSPSLSVCVCVCVSVLAAIVVVAVAIVVIRAARFTEPADRSPRFAPPASIIVLFVRDHGLWSVQCSMFMAFTRTHSTSSPRPLLILFPPARWHSPFARSR